MADPSMIYNSIQSASSLEVPSFPLPSMVMPKFSGGSGFNDFWKEFTELIDAYSIYDSIKKLYLEDCLDGKALDVYHWLVVISASYSTISRHLISLYGESACVIRHQLCRQMASIRPESTSLKDELSAVRLLQIISSQLRSMGDNVDDSSYICYDVIRRFSNPAQRAVYKAFSCEVPFHLNEALEKLEAHIQDELYLRSIFPKKNSILSPNPIVRKVRTSGKRSPNVALRRAKRTKATRLMGTKDSQHSHGSVQHRTPSNASVLAVLPPRSLTTNVVYRVIKRSQSHFVTITISNSVVERVELSISVYVGMSPTTTM